MRTKESGSHGQRRLLFYPAYDPEHLELIIRCQAISALYLHGTGAE